MKSQQKKDIIYDINFLGKAMEKKSLSSFNVWLFWKYEINIFLLSLINLNMHMKQGRDLILNHGYDKLQKWAWPNCQQVYGQITKNYWSNYKQGHNQITCKDFDLITNYFQCNLQEGQCSPSWIQWTSCGKEKCSRQKRNPR